METRFMKRIALILSGCGNKDGAEITESISSILALSQFGANYECFAPSIEFVPKNFLNNQALKEKRNVLIEAARIARSQIQDLKDLHPDHFDGLLIPGGYGVALHFSSWATEGSHCKVDPSLQKVIETFYAQSKPIGAICIAPVVIAKVLGNKGISITLGDDKETILEVEKTGAQHVECSVTDYISDRAHKILTTPAYMYGNAQPHEVFMGISKLVKELVEMS